MPFPTKWATTLQIVGVTNDDVFFSDCIAIDQINSDRIAMYIALLRNHNLMGNVLRDGSWGFRRDGNPQDAVLRDGNDRAYSQEASRDSAIQMHDRNLPPSLCLASKPPYFSTLPSSAIGSDFSLTVENLPLKGEEHPTTSSGKSRPKSHNTNIKTTP